jgi:hypothetical protein
MKKKLSPAEIVRRGREIYVQRFQALLEPEHNGKFIVIDLISEDYEVDSDDLAAEDRLVKRHPENPLFLHCIGAKAAFSFGGAI